MPSPVINPLGSPSSPMSSIASSARQIAQTCGFSGNRTLSRFLERYTGCTAFEYRLGRSNGHRGVCKH